MTVTTGNSLMRVFHGILNSRWTFVHLAFRTTGTWPTVKPLAPIVKMTNRIFLILICIGILIVVGGLFMLPFFPFGEWILNLGLLIVNIFGLAMLLRNGSLTKTIYFNIILISLAIIIIGCLFKIMHWPGSLILLPVGLLGVAIVYTFRFFHKKDKNRFDTLKWLWVITTYATSLCIIMRWVPRVLVIFPHSILLLTILYFASMCMKDKTLLSN